MKGFVAADCGVGPLAFLGLTELELEAVLACNEVKTLEALAAALRRCVVDGGAAQVWLRERHMELGRSPLRVLLMGEAQLVLDLVLGAELGVFS